MNKHRQIWVNKSQGSIETDDKWPNRRVHIPWNMLWRSSIYAITTVWLSSLKSNNFIKILLHIAFNIMISMIRKLRTSEKYLHIANCQNMKCLASFGYISQINFLSRQLLCLCDIFVILIVFWNVIMLNIIVMSYNVVFLLTLLGNVVGRALFIIFHNIMP